MHKNGIAVMIVKLIMWSSPVFKVGKSPRGWIQDMLHHRLRDFGHYLAASISETTCVSSSVVKLSIPLPQHRHDVDGTCMVGGTGSTGSPGGSGGDSGSCADEGNVSVCGWGGDGGCRYGACSAAVLDSITPSTCARGHTPSSAMREMNCF